MRSIILASQSPRRHELLSAMGVPFRAMPSQFVETLDDNRSPEAVAEELGLGKAMAVAKQHPEAIVIGSDTIVTIDGHQLAKADDIDHARQMLKEAIQRPNKVTSSLAVLCLDENIRIVTSANAWVYFKPYNTQLVEAYLATDDYQDKAGAYGVQSGAAPLVDHVTGDADVIVGLPTHLLAPILQKAGYGKARAVDYTLPGVRIEHQAVTR